MYNIDRVCIICIIICNVHTYVRIQGAGIWHHAVGGGACYITQYPVLTVQYSIIIHIV